MPLNRRKVVKIDNSILPCTYPFGWDKGLKLCAEYFLSVSYWKMYCHVKSIEKHFCLFYPATLHIYSVRISISILMPQISKILQYVYVENPCSFQPDILQHPGNRRLKFERWILSGKCERWRRRISKMGNSIARSLRESSANTSMLRSREFFANWRKFPATSFPSFHVLRRTCVKPHSLQIMFYCGRWPDFRTSIVSTIASTVSRESNFLTRSLSPKKGNGSQSSRLNANADINIDSNFPYFIYESRFRSRCRSLCVKLPVGKILRTRDQSDSRQFTSTLIIQSPQPVRQCNVANTSASTVTVFLDSFVR